MAARLSKLASILQTFRWTPVAKVAYGQLKSLFLLAPILAHPDPSWQFVVEVDASDVGVGAIRSQRALDQKLQLCAFYSHRISLAGETMSWGTRTSWLWFWRKSGGTGQEWRHWLEGAAQPFILWTNHKNLTYLRNAKSFNSRQAGWVLFLGRFQFTVCVRTGRKWNLKPDALSCQFASDLIGGRSGPHLTPFLHPASWGTRPGWWRQCGRPSNLLRTQVH